MQSQVILFLVEGIMPTGLRVLILIPRRELGESRCGQRQRSTTDDPKSGTKCLECEVKFPISPPVCHTKGHLPLDLQGWASEMGVEFC